MPNKSALETWGPIAREMASKLPAAKQPIWVQAGEAVDLAKFVVKFWVSEKDPKTGAVLRPGLELLGDRLPATIGADLVSQQQALQEAQTKYLLATGRGASNPEPRARWVLNELVSVLEYHFDDGVEDDDDARLAAIGASHAGHPDTADALAMELEDYAALAKPRAKEIKGLGGFDTNLIEEAGVLASALRDKPATAGASADPKVRDALLQRNQVGALLGHSMRQVRSAARFVFRDHPEIARQAASVYERRKRAEARRKEKKGGGTGPAPQPNE